MAACVLLAGCSASVTGQGTADQAAAKYYLAEVAPLTSTIALGDVTSVDYCSLLDGNKVTGTLYHDSARSSFDYCVQSVQLDSGQQADVVIGYLFDKTDKLQPDRVPLPGKTLPRGLQAKQAAVATPGVCNYYLEFADSVTLEVTASLPDGTAAGVPQASLCAPASRGLDSAASAVTDHAITHLDFSHTPLGKVDACSLLTEDFVGQQLGGSAPKLATPSKHYCEWGGPSDAGDVALLFMAYKPAAGEQGTSQETLGGRSSTVVPEDGTHCSVETALGRDWAAGDDGGKQLAAIDVTTTAGKDPCAVAQELAKTAWPKLPAAS